MAAETTTRSSSMVAPVDRRIMENRSKSSTAKFKRKCHPFATALLLVILTVCPPSSKGQLQQPSPSPPSPSTPPQPQQTSIPIIRLPSNSLIKYTAYRDVSILHFQVPRDTRTVYYTFRAHEDFKSAFPGNKCEPRNITLHIKARSYPVVSPENIQFPQHFFDENQREKIHTLHFKSDSVDTRLTIDGPLPGSWFAVAFISWTDPKQDRIEQQGLTVSCETLLTSEMAIGRAVPDIITDGTRSENLLLSADNQQEPPHSYKFFVPLGVAYARLQFSVLETCVNCPDVRVAVAADALPNADNYLDQFSYWSNITSLDNEHEFFTVAEMWHYVDVGFAQATATNAPAAGLQANNSTGGRVGSDVGQVKYSLVLRFVYENETTTTTTTGLGLESTNPSALPLVNFSTYPLMRQTYREFFMYDFDLLPDSFNETPQYINISRSAPIQLQVAIGDTYDIGGTLSFAVAFHTNSGSGGSGSGGSGSSPTTRADATESGLKLSPHNAVAEKLTTDDAAPRTNQNITVIVCMRVGIAGIPTWPNQCVYGRQSFAPVIVINNTNEHSSTGLVHVPYPETGQWLISMGLFCNNDSAQRRTDDNDSEKEKEEAAAGGTTGTAERNRNFVKNNVHLLDEMVHPFCECAANRDTLKGCIMDETRHCFYRQMNDTVIASVKDCMLHVACVQNHQKARKRYQMNAHYYPAIRSAVDTVAVQIDGEDTCNARLVFTIASNPCVAGRCGQYGRCYHYMSGGVVYSTCLCLKGYRGWDCTEDSEVPDSLTILTASLLLTLSNLLFLPSIYFAIIRKYYTEAVIYFFAMFFSTFYHACDSGEDEFSFCLVKISVLQFSDFYCGLLAIWVTLIAMANLRPKQVSLLHMLGAIILAFGTELNKQSLWVFLTPAVTGLCIITTSWGLRCYKTKKWFPSRTYYSLYLPVGAVLVMIGLCCYAFLQTKQNYHIVHSIWHMVMALSLLCLLPSQKSFIPKS